MTWPRPTSSILRSLTPSSRHRLGAVRPVLEQRHVQRCAGGHRGRSARRRHGVPEQSPGPRSGRPSGPGNTDPDRVRPVPVHAVGGRVATLKIAGQTFGPAYREATQFVVGPHYVVQGTVQLIAGQSVPVEIDYSSRSGLFSQEIHFGWEQPSRVGHPGRGGRGPPGRCGGRVRQRRAGRGHGPLLAVAARRPEPADRRGRGREPAHDRGPEHRRSGADAVAAQRFTACSRPGIPASSSARRSLPCCSATPAPVGGCRSPSRPTRTRDPRRRTSRTPTRASQRRRELRRRARRRLPLVRRHRAAPAVPVRLRALL